MSRSAGRSPETEYRATLARIRRQVNEAKPFAEPEPLPRSVGIVRRALVAVGRALRDVALPFVVAFGAVSPMTPCAHAQCSSGSSSATVVVSHGG